jgi:hypothetical protein
MFYLLVGYDGNKKIKGRKRHILVDTLGLLLAVTAIKNLTPTMILIAHSLL